MKIVFAVCLAAILFPADSFPSCFLFGWGDVFHTWIAPPPPTVRDLLFSCGVNTKCRVHIVGKFAFLGELRGISHREMGLTVSTELVVWPENIVHGNLIDDLRGSNAVHLVLENVLQTLVTIRIQFTHPIAVIQSRDDFRDEHAGFHIQVRKRVLRVIETTGILLLEQIDHVLDDLLRRKYLVGLLRRDVVEDILRL